MENNIEHYKNLDLQDIVYFCEIDLIEKTEQWKDVVGYEGLYQISDLGRTKSKERKTINSAIGFQTVREKIKKTIKNKHGYIKVSLSKLGKNIYFSAHRLVALAFIPNPENKPTVNHIKGITWDNRTSELEWNTISENRTHAYQTGLQIGAIGEKAGACKLTEKQVLEIRAIGKTKTLKEIGGKYKVSPHAISKILNRKTWKHI